MNTTWHAVGIVLLFVLVGGGAWFLMKDGFSNRQIIAPVPFSSDHLYQGAPLKADYRNEQFRFELKMPEGFTAGELPPDENGGVAIVLQNASGEGIQIFATPAGSQKVLTAADVRLAIPDMEVRDAQAVEIGNDYRGVAFLSDNDAFGGASREVWFYFNGDLYQISTYARLDPLLQAMFATWTFF